MGPPGPHENRHREERSDAAIQGDEGCSTSAWIASLRSQ
jgi:hypothetical protein